MNKIILASKSKSRQKVLLDSGISCDICPSGVDENIIKNEIVNSDIDNPADKIAGELAKQKALDVSSNNPDAYVIGGDQTLSLNGKMYSKPQNKQGVINHLTDFSGKTHHLHSGVAVAKNNEIIFDGVFIAKMTVRNLTPEYINWYADTCGDAVCSSVGAYHYEKLGIQLFESVEGDFFTILGLPIIPLITFLKGEGIIKC